MSRTRLMIEMTQPEIAERLRSNPLVLFPAGSVEQHSAHLPAGTDSFAATGVAERVAELLNGLVLPAPSVGVTRMHMPFEATVTFSPDTYIRVVTEICESAAGHGARELLIVNWHEGNIPSLAIAAERLHDRAGLRVAVAQACYVADELYGATYNGHPCRRNRGAGRAGNATGSCASGAHGGWFEYGNGTPDGQAAPHADIPAGLDRHKDDRAVGLVWRPGRGDERTGTGDDGTYCPAHRQRGRRILRRM